MVGVRILEEHRSALPWLDAQANRGKGCVASGCHVAQIEEEGTQPLSSRIEVLPQPLHAGIDPVAMGAIFLAGVVAHHLQPLAAFHRPARERCQARFDARDDRRFTAPQHGVTASAVLVALEVALGVGDDLRKRQARSAMFDQRLTLLVAQDIAQKDDARRRKSRQDLDRAIHVR